MKIEIAKKVPHRDYVKATLRVAIKDWNISGLKGIRVGTLNKRKRQYADGLAHVKNSWGVIQIDKHLSKREAVETVAHEATHIAQYSSGKLRDSLMFAVWRKWLHIPHAWYTLQPLKKNPFYVFAPWEVEARKYAEHVVEETFEK